MAVSLKKKSKTSKRGRRGLTKSKPKHKGGFARHTMNPSSTHAPEHKRMPKPSHTNAQYGGETSPTNMPVMPPIPAMPSGMTAMPSGIIAMPTGMLAMPTGMMAMPTAPLNGGYSKKNSKSHSRSKKSRKHIKKMRR